MKNKIKMIFIISMFLMTSCQNNEINQINYDQEYTSAYVRYKIDSENMGINM